MSEFNAHYAANERCPKCGMVVSIRFVATKPMRVEPRLTETNYGCRLALVEPELVGPPSEQRPRSLQTAFHRCVREAPPTHPEALTLGELRRGLEQVGDSKPVYLRTFNDRGIPHDTPLHQVSIVFMGDGFRVVVETYGDPDA